MSFSINKKWSFLFFMGLVSTPLSQAATPDLRMASGTVLIAAPTALNGPTHQGVWFINPATKSFSLELPTLPSNQVYEVWLVDGYSNQKLSTGIFRAHGGIDSDAAGRFAGPLSLNFPPVPGSDFVTSGKDLADGEHFIVVTVEPYPDADPAPSSIAVLKADIPKGTVVGTELMLENIAK